MVDLKLRLQGRAPIHDQVSVVRELVPADLEMLAVNRGIKAPPLHEVKDSHHALARLLAQGVKPGECSAITGYSLSRISILMADPTFCELLAIYRENQNIKHADMMDRLNTVGLAAAKVAIDRFESDPDQVDMKDVLKAVSLVADRTGHGPSSKQTVNVNVNLADRIEAARERLRKLGPVIEGKLA